MTLRKKLKKLLTVYPISRDFDKIKKQQRHARRLVYGKIAAERRFADRLQRIAKRSSDQNPEQLEKEKRKSNPYNFSGNLDRWDIRLESDFPIRVPSSPSFVNKRTSEIVDRVRRTRQWHRHVGEYPPDHALRLFDISSSNSSSPHTTYFSTKKKIHPISYPLLYFSIVNDLHKQDEIKKSIIRKFPDGTVLSVSDLAKVLAPHKRHEKIRKVFELTIKYDGDIERAMREAGYAEGKNVRQHSLSMIRSQTWQALLKFYFPTYYLFEKNKELLENKDWHAVNAALERIHKLRGDFVQKIDVRVSKESDLANKSDDELNRIISGEVSIQDEGTDTGSPGGPPDEMAP